MVIQNISSDQRKTDITFTIKRSDLEKTREILKEIPVQPPLNLNSDAPAESFKRTK